MAITQTRVLTRCLKSWVSSPAETKPGLVGALCCVVSVCAVEKGSAVSHIYLFTITSKPSFFTFLEFRRTPQMVYSTCHTELEYVGLF